MANIIKLPFEELQLVSLPLVTNLSLPLDTTSPGWGNFMRNGSDAELQP